MESVHQLLTKYPELMYGGIGATACVAGGALIFKIATRKKPTHVSVNCWFCNQDTVVPYGNRNCWDCPSCEQYNGFQENGDYNKPIPAQYMENLNHGVSAGLSEGPRTLQWVNCQMLLCKKCNGNQTIKIKQLASFIPREDENYDEEIEVYKHHLEQTYKLCRPCQTAVEYYIKHQNRQLRAVLFNHQLRRTHDSNKGLIKGLSPFTTPISVISLRFLAFLICAFLVATVFSASTFQPAASDMPPTLSGGVIPSKPLHHNESNPKNSSSSRGVVELCHDLLEMVPEEAIANAKLIWDQGKDNQMAVAAVGLLTCITGVYLAGPIRLRRIDVMASVLWFLVMCLFLIERYLKADASSLLDTAKFSATSLCCLVGFAAAVTTRKPMGTRRARGRRYLPSSTLEPVYGSQLPLLSPLSPVLTGSFVPTPPPNLSQLLGRQQSPRERKASPTSLPGHLNRALYLGTVPSLTRTDSGYLFSGSRPPSLCQDSPHSDYFSLKSGSRPSSPAPSLSPSVAGSVTSSSSSRNRRPLISPARLNFGGQRLGLFARDTDPPPAATRLPAPSLFQSGRISPDSSLVTCHNDLSFLRKAGSAIEEEERKGSSSGSSACLVDTTTGGGTDSTTGSKGLLSRWLWPGIVLVSLSANLFFGTLYMYRAWR